MYKLVTSALSLLLVSGCMSSNPPTPVGDKLNWRSHETKPQWTIAVMPSMGATSLNEADIPFYEFTGVSNRHSAERMAREMAVADATAKAARYTQQLVEQKLEITTESNNSEAAVSNGTVTVNDEITIETVGLMQGLAVKDLYLEQWQVGSRLFFKAYALVRISEEEMLKARMPGHEEQE